MPNFTFVEMTRQLLMQSFADVWLSVAGLLPVLIVALVVLLIGWAIGGGIGRIVTRLVDRFGVDEALETAGLETFLEQGGFKLKSAAFVGALVKWFIFLVFLIAALEMLGLSEVNAFLRGVVLGYLPQVIVATFILIIGAILGDVVHKFATGVSKTAQVGSPALIASTARAAIWVFAVLLALSQLGIGEAFAQTFFEALAYGLALAFALAFGLGGREVAGRLLERVEKGFEGKH